jgi:hypothetical protein
LSKLGVKSKSYAVKDSGLNNLGKISALRNELDPGSDCDPHPSLISEKAEDDQSGLYCFKNSVKKKEGFPSSSSKLSWTGRNSENEGSTITGSIGGVPVPEGSPSGKMVETGINGSEDILSGKNTFCHFSLSLCTVIIIFK